MTLTANGQVRSRNLFDLIYRLMLKGYMYVLNCLFLCLINIEFPKKGKEGEIEGEQFEV